MARLLQTLNDYLGLVAIVALLLAAVGTGFLYRSFFSSKVMQVAVLMTLGLSQSKAAFLYMVQLMILGLISSIVAVALGFLFLPVIQDLTQELLAIPFVFVIPEQTLLLAACLGVFGSFLVGLPFLAQIRQLSPALLLKGDYAQLRFTLGAFALYSLPAFFAVWGLSVWQAHSWIVGSSFLGALILTALLLVLIAGLLLRVLKTLSGVVRSVAMKFAIKDMAAHSWTSISCFLAIGLGAVLINLVPQVRASLQQELTAPETTNLPSLFLFDIQEPQVEQIKRVTKEQSVGLKQISPMIRARLMTVNGEDFDKGKGAGEGLSREEQREMRFRNRGFNLSYRDGLSSSESLYAGEAFSGEYVEGGDQEYPYISVEKRFADRLGLKIGDIMEFDVESIPVKGQVKNLRSVRWTTFQPNFFIQFQLGVLEMAPKTFIAVTESLPEDRKAQLQKQIVDVTPNVSMIDVSRLVERISEIISQMSVALLAMALLCFFAGFVVIYSIAQHQAEKQRWQMGLLKVLGSSFTMIWFQFIVQFAILSGFAALLGVLVSVLMSYIISSFLFESLWVFDMQTPIISFVLIVVTTLAVVSFASFRALQVKPNSLLK
ncbi:MAG: FtsX-like permease family protein [Bdellovibrionales bacterium]|nr:FtsX-like permease family protein [Bdellovibrionales bacterium]